MLIIGCDFHTRYQQIRHRNFSARNFSCGHGLI